MIVEIINTGSELLLGNTVNTHLAYLGQELFPLGLRIARQVTVPDGEDIREALAESLTRADIIIVTGGLGLRRTILRGRLLRIFCGYR